MVDKVLLYISAASDLEYERDILGRAVTEIPVTLGWRIVQTPRVGQRPDLEAAAKADLHIMLFGSDIRAPIGLEWYTARRSGNKTTFFLKEGIIRTPAAQVFLKDVQTRTTLQSFMDSIDLRHRILLLLSDHLLENAVHYALRAAELEKLQTWRDELEKSKKARVEETRGGAGESGIILSSERFIPSEGVLIRKPEDEG